MFGSIKKILSGIVSFLLGFFNKKSLEGKPDKPRKRNGYFLELEETDVPKELKAVAQSVASATNEVKASVASATNEVKAKASELVNNKTDKEPVAAKATPAKAEATKTEPAPTTNQPPKVEVELVQTAEGVQAQAVKPSKQAKSNAATADSNGKAASSTFAPQYLMPSASSRRRPGANMSSYLDMARQVKTPG